MSNTKTKRILSMMLGTVLYLASRGVMGDEGKFRPLRLDDMFAMEQISHFSYEGSKFSVNGQAFVFVKGLPDMARRNIENGFPGPGYNGPGGGQIWVQLKPELEPEVITPGAQDGSSWVAPVWSPDASRLSVLSISRDDADLWIWSTQEQELKRLTTGGVLDWKWIDNQNILAELLPNGERMYAASLFGMVDSRVYAPAAWAKQTDGRTVTASVLSHDPERRSNVGVNNHELVSIDVRNGVVTPVSKCNEFGWSLSPNGKAIVCEVRRTLRGLGMASLEVRDLSGRLLYPS